MRRWPRRALAAGLVAASIAVAVACIEATLVPCGELACAEGMVCTPGGCATQDDAAACVGIEDGSQCMTDAILDGTCLGGACRPVACGNGTLDHNELCDDGNVVPGDGCSLDCQSREECGNGVIDSIAGEQCDDGGVVGLSGDGCSSTCKLEVDTWRNVTPRRPSGHSLGGIAPDRTGRLVMFGGALDPSDHYTWHWNGETWIPRDPPTRPSPRSQFGFAYDSMRGQTILFGGFNGIHLAETWAWDGITWKQLTPPTSPPPRIAAQLAYDAERDRIVLYGGLDANGSRLSDMWQWDGTTWTQLFPQTTPGPRAGNLLAFHPTWRKVVMFGGSSPGADETWSWDGTNWTLESVGTPPGGGFLMTATSTGLLLLTAGETWELGATWERIMIPTITFVGGAQLGYLPGSGAVMFDLTATTSRLTSAWTTVTSVQTPSALPLSVTYDGRRARAVAIAGGGGSAVMGTWEWDGLAWERRNPSATSCDSAVFDSVRGEALCVPYMNAKVSTWDGSTWTDVPSSAGPPFSYAGLVFDTQLGLTLTIGGLSSSAHVPQTWGWNGSTWAQQASLPAATIVPSLTNDPVRKRVYSFGGRNGAGSGNAHDQMFESDGTTWTALTPSPRPSARNAAAFVYAPARQRSILFGGGTNGITYASGLTDTWQWDGTSWSLRDPIISPPAGTYVGTTDALGGVLLLGTDGSTWRLESTAPLTERERCQIVEDRDEDGLSGCADPDCWARCTPLCPPGAVCPADRPRCGDGACGPVEDYLICPADCPS